MFLNGNEEKLMGTLMDFDRKHQGVVYSIQYTDGTEIKAIYDTDFESDNGLDLDEEGYEEYWGVAFELKEIVKEGNSVPCKVGELFEVNYKNFPYIIKSGDGEIVVKNM